MSQLGDALGENKDRSFRQASSIYSRMGIKEFGSLYIGRLAGGFHLLVSPIVEEGSDSTR